MVTVFATPPIAPALEVWSIGEQAGHRRRVAIPRLEIHVGVRFGVPGGIDAHALGVRSSVLRKTIGGGQRAVFARLPLGSNRAVLGTSPAAISGQTVALEDLWGRRSAEKLLERLARSAPEAAAAVLRQAIAERMGPELGSDHRELVRAATELLLHEPVNLVAEQLGTSERHFRRIFREMVGVSPKVYARLRRFRSAVSLAQQTSQPEWAAIAAETGYYDQAHLIAEFRTIGGAAPRALLAELQSADTW